jgi:galactose mutarotase-like enzyme
MAIQSTVNGQTVCTISSPDGHTRASFVPAFGGIGSSLILPAPGGPRELLFLHDWFWEAAYCKTRGGWPFLFPICGRLERGGEQDAYLFNGAVRKLPIHGFSLRVPWTVQDTGRVDELVLRLADSEATRELYPFAFEVTVTYRAENGALVCEQSYTNRGPTVMPYYAGFHPYFLTPPPGPGKDAATVDFKPTRRYLYNPQLTDVVASREPPRPPLSITDASIHEALCGVGADAEARLRLADGLTIHLKPEGVEDKSMFPYLQLYTMAEKPFYCIEPWMGHPNGLNTVAVARLLPPGHTERAVLRLWTS